MNHELKWTPFMGAFSRMFHVVRCTILAKSTASRIIPQVVILCGVSRFCHGLAGASTADTRSRLGEVGRWKSSVSGIIERASPWTDWFSGPPRREKEVLLEDRAWSKFLEQGKLDDAFQLLAIKSRQGHVPIIYMFYHLLKECKATRNLRVGKQVHALAIESGYESNTFLGNHLIRMYASHGCLLEARQVFSKIPSATVQMLTSMISACTEQGQAEQAIEFYQQMRQSPVKPDDYIFVAALKACSSLRDLSLGKQVHADAKDSRFETNVFVGSALVDMYAKCGELEEARKVFDMLPTRNLVTWSAMIAGYVQCNLGQEAIQLYMSMQHIGMPMDSVIFVSILKACGSTGAIQEGKRVHGQIMESRLETDLFVGSALVDMYGRCGSLDDARAVFDRLPTKNVVTWTALINAYGQHNDCRMAMQCFEEMKKQGVKPNAATFTCLLVACSHVGLVHEGQKYFEMMQNHGITPDIDHYTCMVDLIGRAGRLNDAEEILRSMPYEHDSVGWTSLLTSCKMYRNVEVAKRCFSRLLQLQFRESAGYVLMHSIYADAGMWREAEEIDRLRKDVGADKKPAKAVIELNEKVHEFVVGENRDDTSAKLRSLTLQYGEEGDGVQAEDALCGHAEKLALAFGLLNTPEGATLLVTKNLRMCSHCHNGTKVISRMEKREIIVRDAHRVHHFKHGVCSCDDDR